MQRKGILVQRDNEMVTKYSFLCTKCGKKFEINGYWFNQWILHHFLDYKWLIHCIVFHRRKPKKKEVVYFAKMTILWIPLVMFQIVDILLEPLRRIL